MEQLLMERDNSPVGEIEFPVGYYVRPFQEGDEEGWCKCCVDGSLGVEQASRQTFDEKMLGDKNVRPHNIYLIISPSGEIAGTTTYQYTEDENTGCIHMVGIEKSYLGKGLAVPLVKYVTGKMIEDSKERIVLTTDDWRVPAIKTYLKAGFKPVIKAGDREMEERWNKVMDRVHGKGV